jgi:hypothetical protein
MKGLHQQQTELGFPGDPVTTLALGEEGGDGDPVTTWALGKEDLLDEGIEDGADSYGRGAFGSF